MHIGIDASRIAVAAQTGTERYSYALLAALARIDRRNHYTLYCNQLPAALPPLPPTFALRQLPAPRLWTYTRLGPELLRHPPDVVFVPAHTLPIPSPPNSVVTVHDLGYLAFPETHTFARRLELHLTTRWSAHTARQVIAISQATRADLIRHYQVDTAKIHVIHHGVGRQFQPIHDASTLAAARERYGLTHAQATPYLLYIGTVQPRKNLLRLIDAFALTLQRIEQPLLLVLAGKRGWRTAAIEQRAATLGIADHVRFTGYVDDHDLPALLSGALAFVFPSLYEGFGMPVLEAMACGTPVLTSTTSSLPEVAGDAALLVAPHDSTALARALQELISNDALRAKLRERGLARAAQFTWERCAAETLHVLSLI